MKSQNLNLRPAIDGVCLAAYGEGHWHGGC